MATTKKKAEERRPFLYIRLSITEKRRIAKMARSKNLRNVTELCRSILLTAVDEHEAAGAT